MIGQIRHFEQQNNKKDRSAMQRLGPSAGTRASRVAIAIGIGLLGLMSAHRAASSESSERIATDRPDIVESSATVGKGRFQFEASVDLERNHRVAGERTRALNTPVLLRMGFADDWEFRLETAGLVRSRTTDADGTVTQRGWSDTAVGLKWHSTDQVKGTLIPSLAWIFHVDLPSGSSVLRGKGARPSLRVVPEWELPNDFSVGMMPGIFVDTNEAGKNYVGGVYAVVLNKNWTETFRTLIEWSPQRIARARDGGSLVTLNLGTAYLLEKNTQIDFAYRHGMNRNTPEHFVTVGLSMRF